MSLREIAERVGCTRATVSFALRNSPKISAATRKKVQEVAAELGWRPDAALAKQMTLVRASLHGANPPKLALVAARKFASLQNEPAQRRQIQGACRRAEEKGYIMDLISLVDPPLRPTRLAEILTARGVEGVVFIATMDPAISLEHLKVGEGFACVVTGIRYPEEPFHVALPDHLGGCRSLVAELVAKGFSRVGAILPEGVDGPLGYAYSGAIWAGQIDAKAPQRLEALRTGKGESHVSPVEGGLIYSWIDENRPDVILTTDPPGLRSILRAAPEWMARLPVFSLDYYEEQEVDGGLDQLHELVGAAAVDMVVAQINRGESGLPDVQRAMNIEGCVRFKQ